MLKFKERKDDEMWYDAAAERWMPMEIKGIKGYFTEARIDRDTVSKELWEVEVRKKAVSEY